MKKFRVIINLVSGVWLLVAVSIAEAAPCLIVTLTGTQGGPSVFNGQAGAGTLVRYGDDSNDCGAMKLQFDTGRGTHMRLSQINVTAAQLNVIFFTHMHGDHTEGLADIMMRRWYVKGPKIDIACSSDAISDKGVIHSCQKYVTHMADAFIQSGEVAERRSEDNARLAGGPADLTNVITFDPKDEPQLVWSSGEVKVSAIRSTHIAGNASYRVDTPAGSVVIGGDAGNDVLAPPRASSTSEQVEKLAKGVDIIVHSAYHPVLGPDQGSGFPPLAFYRQSLASDLGAMAKRVGAKHLMLTHLGPSVGAAIHNGYKVPGGPLTQADYRTAVEESGFTGNIIVGTELASVRLPVK
jgi:ribonuclease Z